jgi:hypothetical protein
MLIHKMVSSECCCALRKVCSLNAPCALWHHTYFCTSSCLVFHWTIQNARAYRAAASSDQRDMRIANVEMPVGLPLVLDLRAALVLP